MQTVISYKMHYIILFGFNNTTSNFISLDIFYYYFTMISSEINCFYYIHSLIDTNLLQNFAKRKANLLKLRKATGLKNKNKA